MPRTPHEPLFEVRRSGIHGKGGFALRRIRKGQRIIEYVGERISPEEGDRRYPDVGQRHYHTFLFAVDDHTCIDAGKRGNAARFINHSCDPNCQAVDEGGRIFIEALHNIQPGVELMYDYSMIGKTPQTQADRERYFCHCGAANCRGTMLRIEKPRGRRKRV